MRGYRLKVIVVFVLCSLFLVPSMSAKKPQPKPVVPLSTEQEQQFTYYWYAAKQAIVDERYDKAYVLLEFCHMLAPQDAQTLSLLGVLYGATGQKTRSMEAYKEAFEIAPADQWYRYSDALLSLRTEEGKAAALQVFEKALTAQKAAVKAKKRDQLDEELMEQLRKLYMDSKQWKKALAVGASQSAEGRVVRYVRPRAGGRTVQSGDSQFVRLPAGYARRGLEQSGEDERDHHSGRAEQSLLSGYVRVDSALAGTGRVGAVLPQTRAVECYRRECAGRSRETYETDKVRAKGERL